MSLRRQVVVLSIGLSLSVTVGIACCIWARMAYRRGYVDGEVHGFVGELLYISQRLAYLRTAERSATNVIDEMEDDLDLRLALLASRRDYSEMSTQEQEALDRVKITRSFFPRELHSGDTDTYQRRRGSHYTEAADAFMQDIGHNIPPWQQHEFENHLWQEAGYGPSGSAP